MRLNNDKLINMTLEELSNKLYESKILHDYKDGKIDYRKVHEFIVGLNEALTIPVVTQQSELVCDCLPMSTQVSTINGRYICCTCNKPLLSQTCG